MTDLKPCPFCGGEAHTYKNNLWHVGCEHAHNSCVTMSAFVTEAEAIAAWNTRADYHGYEQAAIEAWQNVKAYKERTCRNDFEEIVRCRDCIYYKPDPDPIDPGWPMMCERTGDDMVEPYGFCAWAERRDV